MFRVLQTVMLIYLLVVTTITVPFALVAGLPWLAGYCALIGMVFARLLLEEVRQWRRPGQLPAALLRPKVETVKTKSRLRLLLGRDADVSDGAGWCWWFAALIHPSDQNPSLIPLSRVFHIRWSNRVPYQLCCASSSEPFANALA